MPLLKKIVDGYMQKVSDIEDRCTRCLNTERWSGKIVMMVVDAAFASVFSHKYNYLSINYVLKR